MHTRQDIETCLRCRDDEPDAQQIAIWQHMTAERKIALAFEMYDFMKELVRSHVRNNHPDYTSDEIEAIVRRRFSRGE
jgi:hypothetical protein